MLPMKIAFMVSLLSMVSVICTWLPAGADVSPSSSSLIVPFSKDRLEQLFHGYEACFVAYDSGTRQYYRYNASMCAERMPPYSTFKIFNSLAGLESGVVTDAEYKMKWDGTKYDVSEAWNHDHTLRSAIRESVVWYFQRVAKAVGPERMQSYLHAVGYGNEDISGGITKFWLGSSLKISPDEQVNFLRRLHAGELPFSERSISIVKDIIKQDQTDKGQLSGKTGSAYKDGNWRLGWFVGYAENHGRTLFFATVLRGAGAKGPLARDISKKVLAETGWM